MHARLSAGADPSRGPVYDQTSARIPAGRLTTDANSSEARQSRWEDSADRSRQEFAREDPRRRGVSAERTRVVRRGVRGDRVPGGSEEDLPAQSQSSSKEFVWRLVLAGRQPEAEGARRVRGYDSSPDSLNGSHRSPGRVSFKDEAVTPNTKAAPRQGAEPLAEAKAPEQRKKMNEAVSVWTEASRGMLPAINPLDSRRGYQDAVERHRVPRPR